VSDLNRSAEEDMSGENPVPIEILLARASATLKTERAANFCLPLLPLLEHTWTNVVQSVSVAVSDYDGLEEKKDTLPEEVVLFALRETSQYWVGLALGWLEDGFPVSARIKEELFSVSQRHALPQKERHIAWRLHHQNA
jgi:hypothetical protein